MLVSGESWMGPPQWFMMNYGPFGQVADLGCGDGVLANVLLRVDPNLRVDAYDVSLASLERARALIATLDGAAERCRLMRIDLNAEALPTDLYDAVLTTGSMHHIENLDFCFGNIRRSLKAGGLLWLNDYVGPNRFQWSDTQMRLADELLAMVPSRWRLRDRVIAVRRRRDRDPIRRRRSRRSIFPPRSRPISKSCGPGRGGAPARPHLRQRLPRQRDGDERGRGERALRHVQGRARSDRGRRAAERQLSLCGEGTPRADTLIRTAFEQHASPYFRIGRLGITGDLDAWIAVERGRRFQFGYRTRTRCPVSAPALMHRTSPRPHPDFAAHGATILRALAAHSPEPLGDSRSLLDFGVGAGRLARLFKGYNGRYVGVDIDGIRSTG